MYSPPKLSSAEKKAKAVELRRKGYQFKEIGRELGVTEGRAHQIISEECKRWRDNSQEAVEDLRQFEAMELEELRKHLWQMIDNAEDPAALTPALIDKFLKLQERRAKLFGLDAPEKKELAGRGGGPLQVNFQYEGDAEL
jgi:IS30 family transposase